MSQIKLHSGIFFDFADPKKEHIKLIDVAHNLSKEQRFGNCLGIDWSVLQHILLCWKFADLDGKDELTQFTLLHHDDPEAYMRDIPTPLKNMLSDYKRIYAKVESAIAEKLEIDMSPFPAYVKEVDRIVMLIEDLLFSPTESKWHEFNADSFEALNKDLNNELHPFINIIARFNPQQARDSYLRIHKKLARNLNKPTSVL